LKHLPKSPGVYLHKNANGEIIYVGKAKVLKNRVKQYFQKRLPDPKTTALVKEIADLEWIETDSELDALFLESELIKRYPVYRWLPVVMIMWCILVQWVTPIHHAVGHLEIFWSRVPIFFIGINMGEMVRQRQTVDGAGIWLIIIMFIMSFASSIFLEQVRHGQFPLFVERMLYIPLTLTTILMLNRVFRRTPNWFNKVFRWVGALSLECYLIHIHFVLNYIPRPFSYWTTFLLCLVITLPLAWLLSKVSAFISSRLDKMLG